MFVLAAFPIKKEDEGPARPLRGWRATKVGAPFSGAPQALTSLLARPSHVPVAVLSSRVNGTQPRARRMRPNFWRTHSLQVRLSAPLLWLSHGPRQFPHTASGSLSLSSHRTHPKGLGRSRPGSRQPSLAPADPTFQFGLHRFFRPGTWSRLHLSSRQQRDRPTFCDTQHNNNNTRA